MNNYLTATGRQEPMMSNNMKAFLSVIRRAEGTYSENGYKYLFGSRYNKEKLFDSYADHPKQYFSFKDKAGKTLKTSAAGAYQFIWPTWRTLKKRLNLKDFSPANQDIAAIELIREKGAIPDIEAGNFEKALNKVRAIWASLPGSGNNQPEITMNKAIQYYKDAGGKFNGGVPLT